MDSSEEHCAIINEEETDDEDTEYFLQATVGAYDIKEKIKTANHDLFEDYEMYINIIRKAKVTFREQLVDYEPDYNFDDCEELPDMINISEVDEYNLYASDPNLGLSTVETYYSIEENKLEISLQNDPTEIVENYDFLSDPSEDSLISNSIMCEDNHITDEEDILDDEGVLEDEDVIEDDNIFEDKQDILDDEDLKYNDVLEDEEYILDDEESIEVIEIIQYDEIETNDVIKNNDKISSIKETSANINDKSTGTDKKKQKTGKINCQIHCLEKKELNLICGNIPIPVILEGPILQLRHRTCCTNKDKQNLPIYNGLISEYGLTKTQIDKRHRRIIKSAQRRKDKLLRLSEEKRQKDLYNEEIFSAWLASLRERNQTSHHKSDFSIAPIKERPKTASNVYNSRNSGQKGKRRPYTSPCKGFTYTTVLWTL